jgi:hypothetical protein
MCPIGLWTKVVKEEGTIASILPSTEIVHWMNDIIDCLVVLIIERHK